jgi:hypothetical protein
MALISTNVTNLAVDAVTSAGFTAMSPWMTDCGSTPIVVFYNFLANESKFLAKFTYMCFPNSDQTRVEVFDDFDVPSTYEIMELKLANSLPDDLTPEEILANTLQTDEISTRRIVMDGVTPNEKPIMTGFSEFNKPFVWSADVEINDKFIAKKPMDVREMLPISKFATKATMDTLNYKFEKKWQYSSVFRKIKLASVLQVLKNSELQVVVKYGKCTK